MDCNTKKKQNDSWLSRFATKTTLPTINDIYESDSICARCFWLFILLLCIGGFAFYFWEAIRGFVNSKPSTTISTVREIPMELPKVAVCDGGGLNLTRLVDDGFPLDKIHTMMPIVDAAMLLNESDLKEHHDGIKFLMKKKSFKTFNELLQSYAYDYTLHIKAHTIYRDNNSANDSVVPNTWLIDYRVAFTCWVTQFSKQLKPGFAGHRGLLIFKPVDPVRADNHSETILFTLELFSGQSSLRDNPMIFGYGYSCAILVHKKVFKRLMTRMSELLCDPRSDYGSNCQSSCETQEIFDVCGCEIWGARQQSNYTAVNTSACTPYEYKTCYPKINQTSLNVCQYQCKPPCEETTYTSMVTTVPLADDTYSVVVIAYSDLSYTRYEESDAYTMTSLVSNIGGQLGLWLGMSIASIIQAITLCASFGRKKVKKVANQNENDENINPVSNKHLSDEIQRIGKIVDNLQRTEGRMEAFLKTVSEEPNQ